MTPRDTPPSGVSGDGLPGTGSRPKLIAAGVCGLLLVGFALLAHAAVVSKSATYDEPLHATSAWLQLRFGDFRIDPEDPALWKYWAALPNGKGALRSEGMDRPLEFASTDSAFEWPFVHGLLYRTEGNVQHSDDFIQRSRNMMLILGVGLGAVIGWWSWKLGGLVSAVVATAFYALDPNFLAHAPLVKNDVPFALMTLGLVIAVWRMGQRLTVWNVLAVALLCTAAINTKFSALLLGPIVAMLLVVRAVLPVGWAVMGRQIGSIAGKLGLAVGVCVFAAVFSYAGTWAVYQFRFRPAPDRESNLNLARMIDYTNRNEIRAARGIEAPTSQEVNAHPRSAITRAVVMMNDRRLLPQAFLNGFLYTYQSALARKTFMLGDYSNTGWWYYFPLAMLVKSPIALIVAAITALGVYILALRIRGSRERTTHEERNAARWTAACLAIPPVIYMIVAMRSNLNLGLRHVLPVYPFIYIGIGLAAGFLWQRRPVVTAAVAAALALLLFLEGTFFTFPDYIAFFNGPSKPHRLDLFGDSNLDWGQDLKLLAEYQRKNLRTEGRPAIPLYLVYFGFADPWAYGIDYVNFPGGYPFGPRYEVKTDPGVIAISATHLQGIYHDSDIRKAYGTLKSKRPIDVLGGTIYLYEWPPQLQQDAKSP